MRLLVSFALSAGIAAGATAPAAAQTTPLTAEQPYHQTLSINPIALPFGWFAAEYERAISPAVTFGLGGTYFDIDDDRAGWFDAKVLYYPNETALKGFAVGLTAGFQRSTNTGDFFDFSDERRTDSGATLGVVVDYNWLLGKRDRFLIGLGIGAKRVLKNVSDDSALDQVIPAGRFQIGLAF